MYRTLFDIAAIGMIGWILLIFLPTWRITRRAAETAIFPIFLAVLYVGGLGIYLLEAGPGFMADFGSADGVIGLLALEPVALVAWIHILAFDQVVGLLIYRDNMKRRYVPLPLQSLILFLTLMLGPVGFLSYLAVRMTRQTGRLVAWGDPEPEPVASPAREEPASPVPQFHSVVRGGTSLTSIVGLLRYNPALVWLGILGLGLAAMLGGVAAVNGSWLLGAEGRLLEAAKFDGAVGIYILTLALVLPLAPFSARKRRRWVAWAVALLVFSYGVETIQALRGLDPRFSAIAGPIDQAIGGIFFLAALGVLVLFLVLMTSFFRSDVIPDHPGLRLALRYATVGSLVAFGSGIAMSVLSGRVVGGSGDLMTIHAVGFHGLQAVPLVALILGTTLLAQAEIRRFVHLAGIGWLTICVGLVLQAVTGQPTLEPTPALAVAIAGGLVWLVALVHAVRARSAAAPAIA
jgi:hypothetical protein